MIVVELYSNSKLASTELLVSNSGKWCFHCIRADFIGVRVYKSTDYFREAESLANYVEFTTTSGPVVYELPDDIDHGMLVDEIIKAVRHTHSVRVEIK